jgi:hypothetical protein
MHKKTNILAVIVAAQLCTSCGGVHTWYDEHIDFRKDRETNAAFGRLAEVFNECVRQHAPTRSSNIDPRDKLPKIRGYEDEPDILRVDACMMQQHYRGFYMPYSFSP